MDNNNKLLIAIEVAQQEKDEILQQVAHLDKQITSYRQKLVEHKDQPPGKPNPPPSLSDSKYDIESSWVDKIANILKNEKKFLHSRQIQNIIIKNEPGSDKLIIQRRVSSGLSRLKKEGSIVNKNIGNTNQSIFWGSPNWLDENKKIKDEFMYDIEYVKGSKNKRRIIE